MSAVPDFWAPPAVLLVDDEPCLPRGLGEMLDSWIPVRVVASASSAAATLAERPHCALVTRAALTDGSGVMVARLARHRDSSLPVLISARAPSWREAATAYRLGADYIPRDADFENAVADVVRFLRRNVRATDRRRLAIARVQRQYGLTPRQRQILELAAEGVERKRMADRLGLRESSVKTHINRMLRATRAFDLSALVELLDREGAMLHEATCGSTQRVRKSSGWRHVGIQPTGSKARRT